MLIGIYKPFKKIFFNPNEDEHAAWSYEVVNLVKILEKNGHSVKMITECDDQSRAYHKNLMINRHENLKLTRMYFNRGSMTSYLALFDRIFVVGGSFHLDKIDEYEALSYLRKIAGRLDLIITDQKLVPQNMESWSLFNTIYTQSTFPTIIVDNGKTLLDPPVPQKNIKRSYTEELVLFGYRRPTIDVNFNAKNSDFYFGGGERGRTKSFFEFVYRPNHVLRVKSDTLKIDNRVAFTEHTALLSKATATIVIADTSYNMTGFITPRQYEGWMASTAVFCERQYDPLGKIFALDSKCRVGCYVELQKKIQELKDDPACHRELIQRQHDCITPDMTSGENIYRALFV